MWPASPRRSAAAATAWPPAPRPTPPSTTPAPASCLPTPDDVVLHFCGKAHWWTDLTGGKKPDAPKGEPSPGDKNKEPDKADKDKDKAQPGAGRRGAVSDLERLITAPEGLTRDRTGS